MAKRQYGVLDQYDNILVKLQKSLRLYDADSSNYIGLKSAATVSADFTLTLPAADGSADQALATNGSGVLSFQSYVLKALATGSIVVGIAGVATAADTLAQGDITVSATGLDIKAGAIVNADVNASAAIDYSKLNLASSIVNADINASAAIAYSKLNLGTSIVNADINASAAIALSKLAALTASRALVSDGSGFISASSVTSTELGYVSGVTSAIQTQINNALSLINNFEWQPSALSRITTPPGSPTSGDRHLVIATATGAWVGQENKIAQYNGATWDFTTPTTGMYIGIDNESDGLYLYGGASWAKKYFEATTASTGLVKTGFDIAIDSSAAGAGLGFSAGVLSVNVDASTIEINADTLRVKDAGITNAKVATGIDAAKIADGTVSNAEFQFINSLSSNAQDQIDSKASKALDNLAAVAINTSLLPATDNSIDVGSATKYFASSFANIVKMKSNSQVTSLQGSASASASVAYKLPPADGTSNQVLTTDGSSNLSWTTASSQSFKTDWALADGVTKVITHSLNTKDVMIQLYDKSDDASIGIDAEVRTDVNTVTLTASQAPGASGWRVMILKV